MASVIDIASTETAAPAPPVVDDDFEAIETLYGVGYRYREA
jgi:hypothetical protein